MKLDRHTYEAWLLDRLEGNLTPEQERQLDAFLTAHPELVPGPPDAFPRIDASGPAFPDKDLLLRTLPPLGPPQREVLDDHLAARLEGDLDPLQEQALDRYLYEHPEAARDARLMALSKLSNEPIPFPGRDQLVRSFPPQGEPDRHRLTDFLIAAHEGDLDLAARGRLTAWLAAHPEQTAEDRLVRLASVVPRPMRFPDKQSLYKREGGRLVAWSMGGGVPWGRLAAAASLLLLMGAGLWWMGRDADQREDQVATVTEVPTNGTASTRVEKPAGTQETSQDPMVTEPLQQGTPPVDTPPAAAGSSPGSRPTAPQQRQAQDRLLAAGPGTHPEPANEAAPTPDASLPEPIMHSVTTQAPEPLLAVANQEQAQPTTAALLQVTDQRPSASLGDVILQRVRGRLHDASTPEAGPISGDDAVAAIDKGLRHVAGQDAGLRVERDGRRLTRLDLRFGKGLAVTASRGE